MVARKVVINETFYPLGAVGAGAAGGVATGGVATGITGLFGEGKT